MTNLLFMAILLMMKSGISLAITVYNPYFHFPGGSEPFMGMIVTIAIPVEAGTPGDIILSTILEGNYVIPWNQTEFEYPPNYPTDSEKRTFLYEIFRRKIEEFGYSGKNCLLRAICETSQTTSLNTGVLGDIVHILLTPSSSQIERQLEDYESAEKEGRKNGCKKYKTICPYSILSAISSISNFVDLKTTNNFSNKIVKLF